ncbi:MAG: iron-containing alcohol dehydrogenase [Planctomycetales bacterium]|nr:iron-containing alcohol dehydrogenase [Planctomycetales bacterium]
MKKKRYHPFPSLRQPAQVTFGSGSLRTAVAELRTERTVYFVSAAPSVQELLVAALAKYDRTLEELCWIEKPPGEPNWQAIQQGAAFLQETEYDTVVAIGGGSVLDWSRLSWALAAGILQLDSPRSLASSPDDAPGFWLVPSTCATGAEAASVAVFTHDGEKRPVVCDAFLAKRVLLDARFLNSLSPAVRAQSLADAMSHGIEAFLSIVPNYLAKEMALASLGLIFEFHESSSSDDAQERLLEASYLAGLAASHCSVGVIHAFAHSVARWGIPHGMANAIALAAGIEANRDGVAMQRLISRLGLASVQALLDKIDKIVAPAFDDARMAPLLAALRHADDRNELIACLERDVCLRTSPLAFDRDSLAQLLNAIERKVVSS